MPNFDEISHSTTEIKLLLVSEKRTAAILEFYFQFRFWPIRVVASMIFCICLPNFVVIGRSVAELWRHIDFSRWRS